MNVNDDTIKLLRECDAGVEMGIKSLDNVIDDVESDELRKILEKSKINNNYQELGLASELFCCQ